MCATVIFSLKHLDQTIKRIIAPFFSRTEKHLKSKPKYSHSSARKLPEEKNAGNYWENVQI